MSCDHRRSKVVATYISAMGCGGKYGSFRVCSTVTGANPRIVRREQEESTSDPLNDDELAPNSANGSIPSLIAWTEPKPPGNAAAVSSFRVVLTLSADSHPPRSTLVVLARS